MAVIDFPTTRPVDSSPAPAHPLRTTDLDITRLYRAHVSPDRWRDAERTFFVEAGSREGAIRKIAAVVAALEYCKPEEASARIYNCTSAEELIDQGVSEEHALRLMETGWSGNRVIAWAEQPLFLVNQPAALMKAWARVQGSVQS